MSWITIIWSMVASACLTLAALHLLVWFKNRSAWTGLLYALTAVATAGMAFCELWMMRSKTVVEFGEALWWVHLPAWVVIVLLVGLVRLHLQAGRRWLAWTVCGVRTLSLLLNFVFSPNLNFQEITGFHHIRFLGESIPLAEGVRNPWMLVGQLSFLLLIIFVVDAMITIWRRGDRPQLRLLSAAIVFFFLLGAAQAVLNLWGIVDTPLTPSLFFMGILIVMGVEMSAGVLRAAKLSADLIESEERLSLAAEAAHLGLWVWDIKSDEIWFTPQGRQLFGFTATEPMDLNRFLQALHPEDREVMQKAVAKSLLEDLDYEREYRVPLPEGGIRWVAVRGRVERDHDGQAVRIRGVAFDITVRKLTEESLKNSEEFNRTVLASLQSQIAILDREGTILAVNDAWEKSAAANGSSKSASGVGVDYLNVCRLAADAGNPEVRQRLAGLTSVLNGVRDFFDQEYRCDSPTKAQWFLLSIMPLKSPGGGAVVSHVNITQRKQAELELQLQREELAHLSRVTTLSELSNSLAHELTQPLAIILTNAQAAQRLLAQSPPDLAEARDILTDIVSEDQRAGDIIRRLRALLKPGQAQRQPLAVNDLVGDVLGIARSDLIARSVTVHVALAGNLPAVLGDRIQLQQVMLNLILNACDAVTGNPPGERKLRVTTAYSDGRVVASVSDNGCGLPANLEKIFEPFYTTKKEGLGLGLHISRSIATAHQGRLWAETVSAGDVNSSPGTTLHLELPAGEPSGTVGAEAFDKPMPTP